MVITLELMKENANLVDRKRFGTLLYNKQCCGSGTASIRTFAWIRNKTFRIRNTANKEDTNCTPGKRHTWENVSWKASIPFHVRVYNTGSDIHDYGDIYFGRQACTTGRWSSWSLDVRKKIRELGYTGQSHNVRCQSSQTRELNTKTTF